MARKLDANAIEAKRVKSKVDRSGAEREISEMVLKIISLIKPLLRLNPNPAR